MANLHAEFEVSNFNRSRDMQGSQNSKSRSLDPVTTPFDLILHFLLGPPVANLHAKVKVSSLNRFRDMEWSQNLKKVGHVAPKRRLLT